MQRGAVERHHATGLNTSIPILPELLKEAGYKNYLVGKWHLGYCHDDYLPNNRGFDYFFGQYNHMADYYHRKVPFSKRFPDSTFAQGAHDLHENFEPSYEGDGMFSPVLYSSKAASLIRKHDKSQPLFLYLAFQTPHMDLMQPPKKYEV